MMALVTVSCVEGRAHHQHVMRRCCRTTMKASTATPNTVTTATWSCSSATTHSATFRNHTSTLPRKCLPAAPRSVPGVCVYPTPLALSCRIAP